MKKSIVRLLTAALILSLLCSIGLPTALADSGKTRATTNGRAENSLTVDITEIITTLDPQLFTSQIEDTMIIQIYEPLMMILDDGSYVTVLAEDYAVNEDGSVDFTLKDAVFHSGDTVKSEDVEYTLGRIELSALVSPLFGLIDMEIVDDTHFRWSFPYAEMGAGFDDLMPYIQNVNIINKSWAEERISDPNEKIGIEEDGSGAYCFESLADNGDVVLKRFEGYHGTASIDTLNFRLVTGDPEMAFESGDLDLATYKKSTFDIISQYDNVGSRVFNVNNVGFLILNCAEGFPTADLRVRQAVAYALDRVDLAAIASDDGGTVAYNLANPMVSYYTDEVEHFDFDLDKANVLMSEAGYSKSNKAELTLIVMSAYPDWVSCCEVIKEMLEQSYFTVKIEQIPDTARYFVGDYDLGMIAIGLTTNFASYAALFDSETGLNLAMYTEPDVLEAFGAITDEASTQNAMKVVTDSLAYYPIYYPAFFSCFDADLNAGVYYGSFNGFLYRDFSWK